MATTTKDYAQVIKEVFDETNGALITIPSGATTFNVELDADDGDTVAVQGRMVTPDKASITSDDSGVVVAAFDCSGYSTLQLYAFTSSAITDTQTLTVEVSPHATDNVWMATALTATPSSTSGTTVMGTALTDLCAVRARVSIASAITAGGFDVYIVGKGN